MLSIRGCGYRFPRTDRWALRNVNLELGHGKILFLRGRNGSGKSTLMKLVCGLLEPTEGQIEVQEGVHAIYMDQAADDMLALDLTVQEHLSAFRGFSSNQTIQSTGLLQSFGLDLDLRLDEFVGHLSGGQRQIMALMAIIESGANLLCLDEFLSALDARSAEVAIQLVEQSVRKKKISVIAVSHSQLEFHRDGEIVLD